MSASPRRPHAGHGTATAFAGQQTAAVPISYTYGSAAPPATGRDYVPPARLQAKQRAEQRERDKSAQRRSESVIAAIASESDSDAVELVVTDRGGSSSTTTQNRDNRKHKQQHIRDGSEGRAMTMTAGNMANVSANANNVNKAATTNANALKDTSVNIATAFRQAAAPPPASTASTSAASFLGRAGDRPPPSQSHTHSHSFSQKQQHAHDYDNGDADGGSYIGESDSNNPNDDGGEASAVDASTVASTSTSRKRKKQYYKGVKERDGAFKISKDELNAPDSADEYSFDDAEDEVVVSEGGTRRSPADWMKKQKSRRKKAKKATAPPAAAVGGASATASAAEDGAGSDATAARKKASSRRKSGPKDPAYKPGQEQDSQSDEEEEEGHSESGARKARKPLGPRRVPLAAIGGKVAAGAPASDTVERREDSLAPSDAASAGGGGAGVLTSFYLQAPSSEGDESPSLEPELEPEFKTHEQARLTQIHPRSSNGGTTYQPYFAFSTTTTTTASAGPSRRFNTSSTTATLARAGTSAQQSDKRNASLGSTSQASSSVAAGQQSLLANGGNNTRETAAGGPSSNASFENRGSEYDYAAEEELANALYKAKQSQSQRTLPEGRPFSQLVSVGAYDFSTRAADNSSVNGRDDSLAPSEGGSSLALGTDALAHAQQQQQQRQSRIAGPKRAPAPPGPSGLAARRSPSAFSDSQAADSAAAQEEQRPQQQHQRPRKSFGRQLGELTRAVLLALHWLTVGPVKAALRADWNTLSRWAAAVVFIALMLGAMNERASSAPAQTPGSSKPYYFLPSFMRPDSPPSFQAPSGVPSNFDELVSRLSNLETSFAALSSSSAADRSSLRSASSLLDDSTRRLQLLEADFEAERSKAGKAVQGAERKAAEGVKGLESELKGVKSQLDFLSDRVKTLTEARRTDAAEAMQNVKKDLVSLEAELRAGLAAAAAAKQPPKNDKELLRLVSSRIEELLPARMAVSLDPRSGEVKIDPKFSEHLKAALPAANAGGSSAPSWDAFLASNRASLHKLLDETLADRIQSGTVLSKQAFLQLLEGELASVRRESADGLAKLERKQKSVKLSGGEDLHALVGALVDSALDKYSKDVLARPDFALFSSGARVVPSLTSPTYEVRPRSWLGALPIPGLGPRMLRGKPPVTALHPDINVGQCWPFEGAAGQLGIMLSRTIYPTDITIEHAAREVALDVSSAPRQFELWALVEDQDALRRIADAGADGNRLLLVSGEYDVNAAKHIQTFEVPKEIQGLQVPVSVVLLRVLSNHGNEVLSCVYRVRVGGTVVQDATEQQ